MSWWPRHAGDEALGVGGVGGGEHGGAFLDLAGSESVMNDVRCEKAEANVMMFGVVPGKEILAV